MRTYRLLLLSVVLIALSFQTNAQFYQINLRSGAEIPSGDIGYLFKPGIGLGLAVSLNSAQINERDRRYNDGVQKRFGLSLDLIRLSPKNETIYVVDDSYNNGDLYYETGVESMSIYRAKAFYMYRIGAIQELEFHIGVEGEASLLTNPYTLDESYEYGEYYGSLGANFVYGVGPAVDLAYHISDTFGFNLRYNFMYYLGGLGGPHFFPDYGYNVEYERTSACYSSTANFGLFIKIENY